MPENLYKRGHVWWARVQIKGEERRFSLRTENRGEARQRLKAKLAEFEATEWGQRPRRTYMEAAEKFIDEHLPNLRPRTRERYGVSLIHLAEHFRDMHLDEIRSAALYDFEMMRRETVTPSTIIKDLNCLSSLFSCAET